jgi:hypothetical protein
MVGESTVKRPKRKLKHCDCPVYCKYCGAKLRRDPVGHLCGTRNCQWRDGVPHCFSGVYGDKP